MTRQILPLYRALIAKELVTKYGLSQVEIAEKLDITQAAVSQYLNIKRVKTTIKQRELHKIQNLTRRIAHEISENKLSPKDALHKAYELCPK